MNTSFWWKYMWNNFITILFTNCYFMLVYINGGLMESLFIRYFFIAIGSIYAYCNTLDILITPKLKHLFFLPFSCFIALLASSFHQYNASLRMLVTFLSLFLFLSIFLHRKYKFSFIAITLSFTINYIFLIFSCIITSVFLLIIYYTNGEIPYSKMDIPTGILQLTLLYLLFQNKRLKNGINSILKSNFVYFIFSISILFTLLLTVISTIKEFTSLTTQKISIGILLFLSFTLLYYWRHRITQTYREKLRLANEKSLEDEIATLKAEITTLQADNQHLKQIVHKDNKLVPAMEATVMDFLQSSGTLSAEELSARGNELSTSLHEMALQRKGILTSLSPNTCGLPISGIHTVDGLLAYMEKRAKESNINYRVKIDDNIKDLISVAISEEDLRHLLSDLIENALIATRYSDSPGKISIHLGNLQNRFLLEISDSGIPFTSETYQHFGHEQHTTHTEDGGSGIGLMDIWKIKKKYRASLQIYEHQPSTDIFSKKISFVFDRKNHFLIQTYRDKELQSELTRGDIHIFSYEGD